jgi:hypothetical protein
MPPPRAGSAGGIGHKRRDTPEAMIDASIVIPSYRRPDGLSRALAGCLAQLGVAGAVEIIVVDNDPEGSAESIVAGVARQSPIPIRYVHERRPGISHARNAAVAAALGRYLVFLDDDEEPETGWLAAFLETMRRSGADLAVGPVYPRFPAGDPAGDAYRRRRYTRDARVPTGTPLPQWAGIGNTILDKERCFAGAQPFDPALGLTGSEDTLFLRQLLRNGRKLVWCAEAAVHETVPADRLTPRYLLKRAFHGGQAATFVCATVRPPEAARAARLMLAGGIQAVLYGPAAVALRLLRRNQWLPLMDKAAGGLGKLLWHPRLHPQLYGRKPAPPSAQADSRLS